jgi:hypothetical protein
MAKEKQATKEQTADGQPKDPTRFSDWTAETIEVEEAPPRKKKKKKKGGSRGR